MDGVQPNNNPSIIQIFLISVVVNVVSYTLTLSLTSSLNNINYSHVMCVCMCQDYLGHTTEHTHIGTGYWTLVKIRRQKPTLRSGLRRRVANNDGDGNGDREIYNKIISKMPRVHVLLSSLPTSSDRYLKIIWYDRYKTFDYRNHHRSCLRLYFQHFTLVATTFVVASSVRLSLLLKLMVQLVEGVEVVVVTGMGHNADQAIKDWKGVNYTDARYLNCL